MTQAFENVSVLITGHTGFKGSWLSLWLHALGAKVHGYALNPPTTPSMFEAASVSTILQSDTRANISDLAKLRQTLTEIQPSVVFHLAAQPLVRIGYAHPIETFATNVMGTANLLEAIRGLSCVQAVVIVTTDKVYENREWIYPYREVDPLGGHDPYSASKAAAEIVTASYQSSFFPPMIDNSTHLATARAGNVIGGGDWALDRLLPDCLRAFAQSRAVQLRYPGAIRPWQHVLEPLAGYLLLASKMLSREGYRYACAWNFGPGASGDATVGEVAKLTANYWGDQAALEIDQVGDHPHEASLLRLDISRARQLLGWQPCWTVEQAVGATVDWHRTWQSGKDMAAYTLAQIEYYQKMQTSWM